MNEKKREITRIPSREVKPKPAPDEEYLLFANIKGAAIRAARLIYQKKGSNSPADVLRFIDEFGLKS